MGGAALASWRPRERRRTTGAQEVEKRLWRPSTAAIVGTLCSCLAVSYSSR